MKKNNFVLKNLIRLFALTVALNMLLLCVSCSSGKYVSIDSEVGAHYLMFKTLVDNHTDISRFSNLSFDVSSTSLSDDENAELSGLIKKYCTGKNVNYIEMSKSELRESNKIKTGIYGDEFDNGYLLTYSFTGWIDDDMGELYTGEIMLWHNGLDAVGCLNFRIRKDLKGWYIDDSDGRSGYSTIVS